MVMLPDCDEISVAIALCEANGNVEKAIDNLLQNNTKRQKVVNKIDEESKSLALGMFCGGEGREEGLIVFTALQLQDELNGGPSSDLFPRKTFLFLFLLFYNNLFIVNCL
jgi:hypothetical protein